MQLFVLGDNLVCEGKRGNLYKEGLRIENCGDGLARPKSGNLLRFPIKQGPTTALSLHGPHSNNYYHFFMHSLTRVVWAEEALGQKDFPILINEDMAQTPFFRDAVSMGFFCGHELIIQRRKDKLKLAEIAIVKPGHFPNYYLDRVLDRFNISGNHKFQDKVFITRGNRSPNSRTISNINEVETLLRDYAFRIVDPQDYDLAEQMNIFSKAGTVISPHGAGLTNIAFRRFAPLFVYEIFPKNLQNQAYIRLCKHYGFEHKSALMAKYVGNTTSGTTEIDCQRLKEYLSRPD